MQKKVQLYLNGELYILCSVFLISYIVNEGQKEELSLKKVTRFAIRSLSLILMLVVLMSVMTVGVMGTSAATVETSQIGAEETRTIYFSPNGYWNNLFAVYAWEDGMYDSGQWTALQKVDTVDGLYSVEIATEYTNAIFCSRTVPAFSWDYVDQKTDALVITDNYNYLSLAGEATAVWGYYNSGDMSGDTVNVQKIYFTPNEEWTYIQGTLYHDFIVHAWNATNTESVWVECTLVEGVVGQADSVWLAEIPDSYMNVEFCRAESTVENGWYIWEQTDDQAVPSDSNHFTQLEDSDTGTWSYYTESEANPDDPDGSEDPDNPTTDVPTEPTATQTIYFTPNAEWISYVSESEGRISVASKYGDNELLWTWAVKVTDNVYSVNIPEDDTAVVFGVSFGATPELVWTQTNEQTVPADSNYFTQDSEDYTTGTWSTYQSGVEGIYYSVAFADWDGTLLSAQAVISGGSATAPEAPTRSNDSRYEYSFNGWDKSFENVTSDLVVTAQYDKTQLPPAAVSTIGRLRIEVSGGNSFTIAVNGGNARPQGASYINTKMPIGASVTVVAPAVDGVEFIGWMNQDGGIESTSDTLTFNTSGNDYFKAAYKTVVEGVNVVIFKNAKAKGGNGQILDMQYYASEDEITFPDAPTQAGYTFKGWSLTAEEIKAALAAGQDVIVTSVWELAKIYIDVTVNGGTISTPAQSNGKYLAYNAVTVVAGEAPAGQKFAYWTDADGKIMSYDIEYKLYPAQSIELTAVYVAESETIEKQALVTIAGDPTVDGEKITYTISWDVDTSVGKITNYGLVVVDENDYDQGTFYHGSGDSKLFDRAVSTSKVNNTTTINLGNRLYAHSYNAIAFVIYTDAATGEAVTAYSDMITTYKQAP